MESPLRLLPLECTQAHSHHEQNKIQTVTVNLTQCDCLYPCPFHITSLFHGREYTHSISIGKLEARIFLLSNFKGPNSQDQQKTIRCRLITSKVTLTGQSHFMLIFVLRKVTLRDYTNFVQ
jgi:hypothetical protein